MLQNAETVPKKTKKNNPGTLLSSGLRIPGPQAQDPVRIGFFGFFGTVSAFCNIWIGFIGFIGTVTQNELVLPASA